MTNCEQLAREYGKKIKLSYDGKALKMFPRSSLPTDKHCVHCARKEAMRNWYEQKQVKVITPTENIVRPSINKKKLSKEEYYERMVVQTKAIEEKEFESCWNNVIKRRQSQ